MRSSDRTVKNGERRRVVVTGLGMITPLGSTVEKTWDGILAGKSGIGPITRFTLRLLPTLDARADSAGVAATLFVWNAAFGFGVIALASLYSVGPISLAYFAPWTWLVRFGIALGTNSFALFVPGARIPPLDLGSIVSHAGIPELIAYIVLATVLANASLWRQRRLTDRNLVRIRYFRDIRLTRLELSLVAVAFVLLAGAALIETSQIARLQAL